MVDQEITLTCSLDVTAQKTISVKFCAGNMRKQIPPIGLLSLTRARVLCFLSEPGKGEMVDRREVDVR